MAIDWVVNYDCQAKQELSTDGILQALKARGQAEAIIEAIRGDEPEKPIEEMTVQRGLMTPEGMTTEEVRVADLVAQAQALDPHKAACDDCQGNVSGPSFGCFGAINFPLSAEGERWLIDQLPESLDGLAGQFLKSGKEDFEWDGSQYAAFRQQGDTFFELKQAPVRTWGRLLSRFRVSADELYYAMFLEEIQPVHGALLCLFVGAVNEAEAPAFLSSGDAKALPEFRFAPQPGMEHTTGQLQMFFKALHTAARLGVTVGLDL